MYHFPNQTLYHHNNYQQCVYVNLDHSKNQNVHVPTQNEPYEQIIAQNTNATHLDDNVKLSETQEQPVSEITKKKLIKKTGVDTSTFSIEERLLAAVWVHERKRNRCSVSQIKQDFRQRFGRDPPAKNTLMAWERKLFATGSVCDAPRPGRPINRSIRMEEVLASVSAAPALSLRARSLQLRVPRTTLRTMLHHDLPETLRKQHQSTSNAKSARKQAKCRLKKVVATTAPAAAPVDPSLGAGAGPGRPTAPASPPRRVADASLNTLHRIL